MAASYAQAERQGRRSGGQYSRGPVCSCCGRPCGWNYCTDPRHDDQAVSGGVGHPLCGPCGRRLGRTADADYRATVAALRARRGLETHPAHVHP